MKTIRTLLLGTAMALPALGHAQETTTINLIQPIPKTTLVYAQIAAETLGFFEEEGIEVNLLPSDTSIPYVAFLENGQADVAFLDLNETFSAVNAGANIATIFEVTQQAPEGIAVSAGSDVQSMQDLVGTTVGLVTDRDRGFLAQALLAAGLSIDDVDTVVLGDAGPTLAAALRDSTVSAVSGAALDWGGIEASGIEIRLITPAEAVETPANSFAVNADRLEELRPALEGFLRAWAKGAYVGEVDLDILAEIGRQAVPEEWEDEEFGQSFVQIGLDLGLPLTEQYGDLRFDVWEEVQPRMIAVGDLEEMVPLESFLDDSLIEAANDWSREEVEAQIRAWGAENM